MNLIWFKTNKLLDDTNNGKILANITIRLINAVEEYLASIGRSVIQSFSRQHELEANSLGMTIINWAGYDISGIPNFWRKMSQTSSHEFDFFSTYPADSKRIKNIENLLKEIKTNNNLF